MEQDLLNSLSLGLRRTRDVTSHTFTHDEKNDNFRTNNNVSIYQKFRKHKINTKSDLLKIVRKQAIGKCTTTSIYRSRHMNTKHELGMNTVIFLPTLLPFCRQTSSIARRHGSKSYYICTNATERCTSSCTTTS